MKVISAILLFCALLFTNCKKAANTPEEDPHLIQKAPFENSQFKIERASINLPESVIKIHFFDESNGICLTDGSNSISQVTTGIYSTNDRGATWTLSYELSKSVNCIHSLGFEVIDNQTIIAFIDGLRCASNEPDAHVSLIIRSTDRGKTWSKNSIRTTQLRGIALGWDKIIYVIGDGTREGLPSNNIPTFFFSEDKGLSWHISPASQFYNPYDIFCMSLTKIIVLENTYNFNSPQFVTNDKGVGWETKEPIERIKSMSISDKKGYYSTWQQSIYQTNDSGEKWTKIRTLTTITNEVKAVSPTTVLILGKGNNNLNAGLSLTFDGGKTWTDMNILDDLDTGQLIASSFYDTRNGYIVASKKVLYKITLKQ